MGMGLQDGGGGWGAGTVSAEHRGCSKERRMHIHRSQALLVVKQIQLESQHHKRARPFQEAFCSPGYQIWYPTPRTRCPWRHLAAGCLRTAAPLSGQAVCRARGGGAHGCLPACDARLQRRPHQQKLLS